MLFGVLDQVGPRNDVLNGVKILHRKGIFFLGGGRGLAQYYV